MFSEDGEQPAVGSSSVIAWSLLCHHQVLSGVLEVPALKDDAHIIS